MESYQNARLPIKIYQAKQAKQAIVS